MSDKNNKKEIEKTVPPYLNQSNAVSTTFCKITSVTSYRIIRCGLYLLAKNYDTSKYDTNFLKNPDYWGDIDWSDFSCEFSVPRFCELLELKDGTYQRREIKKAISDALKEQILIAVKNDKTGAISNDWYTWFVHAHYEENSDSKNEIKLRFNPGVLGIALDHQNHYSHLELEILGALSSVYALRIYELVKSYYNMHGKEKWGNKKGEWKTKWFSIDELRGFLDISPLKYAGRTDNLIKKAVKEPVDQINEVCKEKQRNLHVDYELERGGKGNAIKQIRFVCTENTEWEIDKNESEQKKIEKRELNQEQNELDYYKEKYKDNWDKICETVFNIEKENNPMFASMPGFKKSELFIGNVMTYIKENYEN